MQRTEDWLRQSRKDLAHSKKSLEMEDFEWACFSAQQSAKKAVKALYQSIRAYAHGHSVSTLLQRLPRRARPDARLIMEEKLSRQALHSYPVSRFPPARSAHGLSYEAGRNGSGEDCGEDHPTLFE